MKVEIKQIVKKIDLYYENINIFTKYTLQYPELGRKGHRKSCRESEKRK